jgi:hypothetical protein
LSIALRSVSYEYKSSAESSFRTLSDDVQKDINKINEELVRLNGLIENEKTTYKNINLKLGIAEHKNNASTELISDYKQMYEYAYKQ